MSAEIFRLPDKENLPEQIESLVVPPGQLGPIADYSSGLLEIIFVTCALNEEIVEVHKIPGLKKEPSGTIEFSLDMLRESMISGNKRRAQLAVGESGVETFQDVDGNKQKLVIRNLGQASFSDKKGWLPSAN